MARETTTQRSTMTPAAIKAAGFRSLDDTRRAFGAHRADCIPERIAIATFAYERSLALAEAGWKMRTWQPTTPGSPFTVRRDDGFPGGAYRDWLLPDGIRLDHQYRLITPEAETIFVNEPYDDGKMAERMQEVLGAEWAVTVRPEMTLWNPGGTIAIWIRRVV